MVAKVLKNGLITTSSMRPGDALVMTKWAGLEGTAILAADHRKKLEKLDRSGIQGGKRPFVPVFRNTGEPDRLLYRRVSAMHDATEGGVLGALWEMADASGCGVEIDKKSIPVLGITQKPARRFPLIRSG